MAERLPFGEIRPGARPIGAFVNPGSVQVAGAARPESMPEVSGFNAIQQGSQGNVQGYNQFAQIAEALAPFSKSLMDLTQTGIMSHVKGKIDEGYYSELKNIQQRSTLSWQMQQEQGAANSAGAITKLERVDPPAAQLLQETNPWRLVGRRRALAQQAGTEIDNMLAADLQLNQGELSALQPGSPELEQRKSALALATLSRYGLTGDEPEAAYYMTPKLNEAWDKYTDKQQKLYNETLTINTKAQVTAALGGVLQGMAQNGIPLADGSVVPMGDPRFAQLAGLVMTQHLDKSLTMFGGQAKADALKDIRTQLLGTYGQVPVLGDALGFVQGGNPGDAVRPTWGASNGLEILETRNRGNAARQQTYELGQKGIEQQLADVWDAPNGPGSMLQTDPKYISAVREFRALAAGMDYRDIDGFIKGRMDAQESVTGSLYAPDPLAAEDFKGHIQDLPRSAFSTPEAVKSLLELARQAARAEPTPELQAARYQEYRAAITAKQKQATETTPGLQSAIDKALLEDLGLPQVKPIVDAARGNGGGDLSAFLPSNAGGMAAASGLGSAKVAAFTQRLNNLFLRNAETKIDAWVAKNPGVPLTSSTRNVLISEAIAETRKSEAYKDALSAVTKVGERKVGTGPDNGGALGPGVVGVPRAAAAALKPSTVKGFAVRPVMNGDWLDSELSALSKGKPVSRDLYDLAKRAGTSTNRYLLEQLRFYPQLDPNGTARQYLEQQIRTQRQGQTVSQANWQSVVGSIGNSLMGVSPAAAGTMPTPAVGGGFQYSGQAPVQAPVQAQPAARQVAPAAPVLPSAPRPMAIPQARVGSMPAPAPYNPLAPGSWLMNMIMPARPAMSLPTGGGDGEWGDGPAVAMSHADSGSGFTIPGARDASGRPPIFSRGGANAFAAMVRDSNGAVKASDIASSQRSQAKNAAVGGANGSEHLGGNAMDIHGSSEAWIRKHGAKYGWYVHDYDGSHGGHFEFRGGGAVSGSPDGYLKRLAYLETRIRNIPNSEGSGAMGYFQAMGPFTQEAVAASGGISPRDPDYNRSAKSTWAWIQKHNSKAAAAIKAGRYDEADRLLRNTWPSLPGGSQAQPDQVQREARRYLGGA